jgi:hypothetical protein
MMGQTAKLIADNFSQGVTGYRDHYPGQEQFARIVLAVTLEGRLPVQAVVDTGAPWCVIDPILAERVKSAADVGYELGMKLMIRGVRYKGKLIRMLITLEAERGESLDVDATVFVPRLSAGEMWPYPNFIGLDGFLNRIRFAIDPSENAFYFGPV